MKTLVSMDSKASPPTSAEVHPQAVEGRERGWTALGRCRTANSCSFERKYLQLSAASREPSKQCSETVI